MTAPQSDRLVVVARYSMIAQAEVAKIELEEAGINAAITGAEIVVMDWTLGNAVGGIRVEVLESDAARASEILAALPAPRTLGDRQRQRRASDSEQCLACGVDFPANSLACPVCGWTFAGASTDEESPADSQTAARYRTEELTPTLLQSFRGWGRRFIQIWAAYGVFALVATVVALVMSISFRLLR